MAVRRGNPLHCGRTEQGLYLASLADGLPGSVWGVKDRTACLFTAKGARHATV